MKNSPRLFDELIIDNFAGGGGASTGIELALGRPVDIAINHDPDAIEMHKMNHPYTKHYCESVWDINPVKVCDGRPVALVWLSPDCTHFSKAKGSKPVKKEIRGLAWIAVKWAKEVKPRVIMLENVEEFKTWGPLDENNYPDKERKGETFKEFIQALRDEGYQVEYKELRACDYGAPTTRKRFFLIARCDGQPIIFPKVTHADKNNALVKLGKLKPYRSAAECIDFSIPSKSIFNRKKPLAEATLKRIARGIHKYVIENDKPFIVKLGQTGFSTDRSYPIDEPIRTIVSKNEDCLITPVVGVNNTRHTGSAINEPVKTITTGLHHTLISPTLIQTGYGENKNQKPRILDMHEPLNTIVSTCKQALVTPVLLQMGFPDNEGNRSIDIEKPVGTICSGGNKFGICVPFISKQYGGNYQGAGSSVDEPLHTITSIDHNHLCEVKAFLIKYYGQGIGQELKEPLHTIPTKDRFGLVTLDGTDYAITDIGLRMLEPRELFNAQGFPGDYVIDIGASGEPITKTKQIARCGNSVPPVFSKALVKANLPELVVAKELETMKDLNSVLAYGI
ncbi:DNA cytosine methyltransferase [Anaerorhabdus sp.]|uniref:DNA cytosine methyltransferase n=1 Tax=Anaerorhabdus sp. TaxID=1872524 RepID=UPI002B1EA038|nr:DNA cytosine methyltransferase [Anaerorhabdus sp.]MEA4875306.1 DNA cytosine methyltransferase [Anaerorhabdus sp.]